MALVLGTFVESVAGGLAGNVSCWSLALVTAQNAWDWSQSETSHWNTHSLQVGRLVRLFRSTFVVDGHCSTIVVAGCHTGLCRN